MKQHTCCHNCAHCNCLNYKPKRGIPILVYGYVAGEDVCASHKPPDDDGHTMVMTSSTTRAAMTPPTSALGQVFVTGPGFLYIVGDPFLGAGVMGASVSVAVIVIKFKVCMYVCVCVMNMCVWMCMCVVSTSVGMRRGVAITSV